MSAQSKWATSQEAKKNGWYSRRYKTQSESAEARERFEAPRRAEATRRGAELFTAGRDKRRASPNAERTK